MERIDVKGLSCPQPVFETKKMIDKLGKGVFEVLTDSATARDNITRLAENKGWSINVRAENDSFILTLKK